MPGRVAARSARSSAVSRKSSAQTLASRASTAHVDIPEEAAESLLRTQICAIFRDAQKTTASHRKLAVNLRKIQEACCYETTGQNSKKTGAEEFDEQQFTDEVMRCILRVMPVKKSEGVGEKAIRFMALFLHHANEKDNELLQSGEDGEEAMMETPSSRLTTHILSTILPLLTAKEKFVRYRATQLISNVINSLDSLDDDLFQLLKQGLLKRIRDKEAMVRVQAVLGLGRLASNDVDGDGNSEDSDGDDSGLLEKLLDVMQNDPSADVRRSLLVNLPILPNTLPFLLERARDQDPATRRALYSRLLPSLGDFRHLSLSMREKLLRWGLRDRDDNVRKAAGRLFRERWIEDCAATAEAPNSQTEEQPSGPNLDALLELLERIDIVNSGVDNGVALEAMKGFWEGRVDYRNAVVFTDLFWDTLTAESVFMARSFNDFCRSEGRGKFESLLEKMPEVTRLAFYLQRYLNVLVDALKRVAQQEPEEDGDEEDTVEQEFIVEQLLHIAGTLDYSDEVGRRKMFALLRQTLAIPDLPEEVTKLTMEVLRGICAGDAAGEKEFCDIVLEAIADVHDTIVDESNDIGDGEESFVSARSEMSGEGTPSRNSTKDVDEELDEEAAQEKAIREIMVNMKCLHMVQCMLENVEGNLQKNVSLVSTLNNLVVPAVRSHEAPVRERGLVCLGLCALLDKSLAEENLTLFVHFFTKGHAALQITALKILTDILNQHGAHLLETNPALLKVYLKALRSGSKTPDVQAAATVAVAKLLLGRVVQDAEACSDLLKTLIIAYFDPSTQLNQGVRQTLSYFLPVYSCTRAENQDRMRGVALDALHALFNVQENLDDDEEDDSDMVSLGTIGAHLVDWTDPRKCYVPGGGFTSLADDATKKAVNGDVHLQFAQDIVTRLSANVSKEEKKVVAALLGKLHVSPTSSEDLLRDTYAMVSQAVEDNLISDTSGRNALYKIHVSLGKIVNTLGERRSRHSLAPEAGDGLGAEERAATVMASVEEQDDADDGMSVAAGKESPMVKLEAEDSDTGTVVAETQDGGGRRAARDSLVSELLSDDDEL